jgi:hypothetical protein
MHVCMLACPPDPGMKVELTNAAPPLVLVVIAAMCVVAPV